MADTSSAPVPFAIHSEQVGRLQIHANLAWELEAAARAERDTLVERCVSLEREVLSLRARIEPLERIARLADALTISLAGWHLDARFHIGSLVRAIQAATRELRPPTEEFRESGNVDP